MQKSPTKSPLATVTIVLLAWLSLWPVIGSALSFVGAVPTRWPALAYFADSPLQWRLLFFIAGCFALTSAWLVHKGKFAFGLLAAIAFSALYVPIFPIVWAQRTLAMVLAIVAVLFVGYLLVRSRRHEV